MSTYHDIDLFGKDNNDGTPRTYYSANAIKNALYQWMNSKRGEYLMNPYAGGPLDNFVFKTMNADTLLILRMQLLTSLKTEFSPTISIESIDIIPDYENRLTEIEVVYTIPTEGVTDKVSLFINTKYSVNTFEYEIVDYVGHNLLEFVTIKKPDQSSNRLLYDYDLNAWKWGKYKLTALTPLDPYFSDILLICNGS